MVMTKTDLAEFSFNRNDLSNITLRTGFHWFPQTFRARNTLVKEYLLCEASPQLQPLMWK